MRLRAEVTYLDGGEVGLLGLGRDDLLLAQDHLLAELNSHDLILLPTVSVSGGELQKRIIVSD